jgi:hypothetical protein
MLTNRQQNGIKEDRPYKRSMQNAKWERDGRAKTSNQVIASEGKQSHHQEQSF